MTFKKIFFLTSLFIFFASCSSTPSRPQLYPNPILKERGTEVSQKDIDECLNEAMAYLKTPEGKKLEKSSNSSSIGTSVGFGFGNMGSGIGLGFGTRERENRLSGEEQVRRNFTNQCLVNKGYQVVGWEIEIGKGLTPLSLSHHPAYGTVPRRFNQL